MKFNSQICTTKEQSERLLALGLKKETADCIWCEVLTLTKGNPIQWHLLAEYINKHDDKHIPAWSLHRLIEMMPSTLQDLYEIDFSKQGVYYADFSNGSYYIIQSFANINKTLYDNIIDCIEWLIKGGHFNKEYLK